MINNMLDELILNGSVEVAGLNEKGEFLYSFAKNLDEINPGLFDHIASAVNQYLISLFAKGFLDIHKNEDGTDGFSLTEKGINVDNLDQLTDMEFSVLEALVAYLEQDN